MPPSSLSSPLHAHDHGGEGPPLVLLHGSGRSLADWDAVAPLLVPHHRVLAVDLPGHGRSPDAGELSVGGWSFAAACEAIERTVAAYGLSGALPVGHSLGGMIALHLATSGAAPSSPPGSAPGAAPGAVNLDGFWWSRLAHYPGLDPAAVTTGLERIGAMVRSAAGLIAPAGYVEQQVAYAGTFGIPRDRAEATIRASVRELPDGTFQTLPLRETALEMFDALDALDLFALARRVPCPVLCVRGRRAGAPTPGMEWFEELTASHAKGLDGDLAALTEERTHPTFVEDIDATHAMLLEEPEAVAALLLAFTRTL
ncbi:alpha/beta fold hydrolase [Streptomyces sp. NPDC087851]|uniref:alpha/beta fold hydrolase n=1 Tax=Streptomyces sp. NPDC087851 TaxID=3365810 RepID=UPI00381C5331